MKRKYSINYVNILSRLKNVGIVVHFILLCEICLLYQIPGYNFIHKSGKCLTKGRMAMYIFNDVTYNIRNDLSKVNLN